MRALRVLAFCLVSLASLAHAQTNTPTATRTPSPRVALATGFEFCGPDTYWWQGDAAGTIIGSGTVTRTTPVPNSDTGNKCLLACDVATGANCAREFNVSATANLGEHISLNVTLAPTTPRRIARFYDSSSGKTGGFLMIVASGTGYRLKPYFLDATTECSGSNNDGSSCNTSPTPTPIGTSPTPTPRCVSAQVGEAQCGDAAYAQPALTLGTSYKIAFGQIVNVDASGAGSVKLELWANGLQLGARTKPQGSCAGGASATYACKLDADCPSSTCTTTDVVTYDRVVFGIDDSAAGAATYTIDDVVVQTNQLSIVKARIEPVYPTTDAAGSSGMSKSAACADFADCMDDLAAAPWVDSDTTRLYSSSAGTQRNFVHSGIGTLGSGEIIRAFAGSVWATGGTTGTRSIATGTYLYTNGGTAVDTTGGADASTYAPIAYSMFTRAAIGTDWTEAIVDSTAMALWRSVGSTDMYMTAQVGEIAIEQPRPDIPSTLSDKNADGEITVAWDGDSRMYDDALSSAAAALIRQPDNIYKCSEGARTTLDVYNKVSAIMSGASPCVVWKGLAGRVPDYIFHGIGVNSGFHRQPNFPRAGRCFDDGGANDGATCYAAVEGSFDSPATSYCVRGANFRQACASNTFCDPAYSTLSSLICDATNVNANPCLDGAINAAGCPNGVCVREWNLAGEWRRQRQIVDRMRSISPNTKLIFVLPADTCETGCGAIASCATGTCLGCWGEATEFLGAQRAFYKRLATEVSGNWIDVNAEFRRRCSPWQACLRDAVHSSISPNGDNPTGDDVVAELMASCLEDAEGDATNTSCANR